jgi:hypothetical protein
VSATRRVCGVTRWLVEGLIPKGAVVAVTDLDDPEPAELIRRGVDVVLFLHGRGAMREAPVLLAVHWRAGLVPEHEPPKPFWIRPGSKGFEPVPEETAA